MVVTLALDFDRQEAAGVARRQLIDGVSLPDVELAASGCPTIGLDRAREHAPGAGVVLEELRAAHGASAASRSARDVTTLVAGVST